MADIISGLVKAGTFTASKIALLIVILVQGYVLLYKTFPPFSHYDDLTKCVYSIFVAGTNLIFSYCLMHLLKNERVVWDNRDHSENMMGLITAFMNGTVMITCSSLEVSISAHWFQNALSLSTITSFAILLMIRFAVRSFPKTESADNKNSEGSA